MAHLVLLILLLLSPGALCVLPAPFNVTIVSFNLEHSLHWLAAPKTPPAARFRVHYLHLSDVSWTPVPWCSEVEGKESSCDLTDSFSDSSSFYVVRVQAFRFSQSSNWTHSATFNPILDTILGPPQVSVSGCGNCLRLQITPPTGRALQHFDSRHLLSEFTCRVHRSRDHIEFTLRVSSSEEVLIEYLEPGVEYCVTAALSVTFNTRSVPSEPHCTYTSPAPVNTVPVMLSLLCLACLLGALLCGSFLYSGSILCLPKQLPMMLASIPAEVPAAHAAAPEPFSLVTVLPAEPVDCPCPWITLYSSGEEEEEGEEDEEEDKVLCTTAAVLATVPEPKNVTVTSVNFGVVLEWESPRDAPGNLTYSAEFWIYSSGFTPGYRNINKTRCDFTKYLTAFGLYKFRVRAELQEETSPWVETPEFSIDKHTHIGAPTVKLISKEGNIEMEIQDPDMRIRKLRDVYSKVSYNIRYWKEDEADEVSMLNDQPQNRVVLLQLEPWTRYCVQAQVYIPFPEKSGEFSKAMCETSTTDGKVKPWVTALVMLGSMVVVMGTVMVLFLAAWYGYTAVKFIYPSVKLPEHFKQYLIEPPHSYIFLAMQNSPQPEEQCHEVFIVSEEAESSATVEGTPPQP
ncbi:hypothetical protein MATL_G00179110 [Megalops atlanticus]|uniref:Tissue factor n=1 Tax=Megalops atlanticus TaxID=7932 RepID=A0A9D3PPD1_MEGAT|nr:hypothetical protein MATL_G00179110 [Megalops atlanticus]